MWKHRTWLFCACLFIVACEAAPTPRAPTSTPSATTRATPLAMATVIPSATPTTPPRPQRMSNVPQALLAYLNADQSNLANLKPTLVAWGLNIAPTPYAAESDVVMSGDVDGDGQADLVVALGPAPPLDCETGALALYLRRGTTFRLAQQIGLLEPTPIDPKISHVPCPTIFAVRDLIHDGRAQIVFLSNACGAHTCVVSLGVLRWAGNDLTPVMPAPLPTMAYPEITLQDNGIALHGGLIGSLGAGPQRERREVYLWNGSRFTLAATTFDPSNFLYFKIVDANTLMAKRQYADAITWYREAITNPNLDLSGRHANERADLQAFARFRVMVAYLLLNDATQAQAARDELRQRQPQHVYAQVADTFWDAFTPQRNVAAGCNAVTAFAEATSAVAAVLADFGYANADFMARDVCPFT